jgi:hypothetical protein
VATIALSFKVPVVVTRSEEPHISIPDQDRHARADVKLAREHNVLLKPSIDELSPRAAAPNPRLEISH